MPFFLPKHKQRLGQLAASWESLHRLYVKRAQESLHEPQTGALADEEARALRGFRALETLWLDTLKRLRVLGAKLDEQLGLRLLEMFEAHAERYGTINNTLEMLEREQEIEDAERRRGLRGGQTL